MRVFRKYYSRRFSVMHQRAVERSCKHPLDHRLYHAIGAVCPCWIYYTPGSDYHLLTYRYRVIGDGIDYWVWSDESYKSFNDTNRKPRPQIRSSMLTKSGCPRSWKEMTEDEMVRDTGWSVQDVVEYVRAKQRPFSVVTVHRLQGNC